MLLLGVADDEDDDVDDEDEDEDEDGTGAPDADDVLTLRFDVRSGWCGGDCG